MKKWKTVFFIFYFGFTLKTDEIKKLKFNNSNFELLFKNIIENYKNIGGIFFTTYIKTSVLLPFKKLFPIYNNKC